MVKVYKNPVWSSVLAIHARVMYLYWIPINSTNIQIVWFCNNQTLKLGFVSARNDADWKKGINSIRIKLNKHESFCLPFDTMILMHVKRKRINNNIKIDGCRGCT